MSGTSAAPNWATSTDVLSASATSSATSWTPDSSNASSQSCGGVTGRLNRSAKEPGPSSAARSVQSWATGASGTAQKLATASS
jgi:hypothetical protein